MIRLTMVLVAILAAITACSPSAPDQPTGAADVRRADWALAVHGGAGDIDRDMTAEEISAYHAGLTAALRVGAEALQTGLPAMEAVTRAVALMEDDPLFNAGRGAVLCANGRHHLQAGIMDGRTRDFGAVAALERVRNPILVARRLAESGPTVFLAGPSADAWAEQMGFETVANEFFTTQRRRQSLEKVLAEETGTVGAVALDRDGHLAAATSSGGRTGQTPGRVGDVPVVGAGTFAEDATCAVSATGKGEQFIRHTVAASIAELIRHRALGAEAAAREVLSNQLEPGDGGVIVISGAGEVALVFNTAGMFRGAADSTGRLEVGIWQDLSRPGQEASTP